MPKSVPNKEGSYIAGSNLSVSQSQATFGANKTPILLASEKLKNLKIIKTEADSQATGSTPQVTDTRISEPNSQQPDRPQSRNPGSRKGMRARKTNANANFQSSPSEALLQNMTNSGGKGITGGSLITASGGAFNINVNGNNTSQDHS